MVERLVLCGGSAGKARRGDKILRLQAHGPDRNIKLNLDDLSRKLAANVPEVLTDLLEIATYVYAADGATSRGGLTMRAMGADWHRSFRFVIPVRNPDLWSSPPIQELLTDTLGFLSDDTYQFEFVQLREHVGLQYYLGLDATAGEDHRRREVILFSGGLDSLAGAAEALAQPNTHVALVSHQSSTKIGAVQNRLAAELSRRARGRVLHVPVRMNKDQGLGIEFTLRSRSFFFAALGTVVAHLVHVDRLRFYENGVISLNLPVAPHVVGARATRSTHPRVLTGLNGLLDALFQRALTIENPFALLTKGEVVSRVADHGCADLIPTTVSCTRVHHMRKDKPHCGGCTQCLGRRFGILAAGLERYDPEEKYRMKLLVDDREEGDERLLALEYVRSGIVLGQMSDWDFLSRYAGEISRTARHLSGTTAENTQGIVDLHRRHGASISDVLKRALREHEDAIAGLSLPPNCLLRLVFGPQAILPKLAEIAPAPEVAVVASSGPPDAAAPMPLTIEAIALDRANQLVLVDDLPPVAGPTAFALMRELADQHVSDRADGLRHENYTYIDRFDLVTALRIGDYSVRREISRIRAKVKDAFRRRFKMTLSHTALIDGAYGKGYRLNPKVQVLDPSQLPQ